MVLPIHDENPTRRTPVVTYALIAANVIVFLLSPLAQANVLQYGSQIPTNPKAPAVGEGVAQVAAINGYMKTAVTVDWESINANRPAWNARWNKTIER